jgi:two-component sensor histidine kinase
MRWLPSRDVVSRRWRDAVVRYLAALVLAFAAAALRVSSFQALGSHSPWVLFYPAVVFAALYGGLGPGLLAAAVSAALGDYLYIETVSSLPIANVDGYLSMAIFVFNGVLISVVITQPNRTEAALKASLQEKEVLLKETHHRVKNNIQVICSLLSLQADRLANENLREVLSDIGDRVRSMALIHEKLHQSKDLAHVDFAEYAQSLMEHIWSAHNAAERGIRLSLDLQPVWLPVNIAVPCGLVLNELVNNALKYAFVEPGAGCREQGPCAPEVAIMVQVNSARQICLRVRDNGVGLPPGLVWQEAKTLGLHLVQMLARQIGASLNHHGEKGTDFALTFVAHPGMVPPR